VEIEKSYPRCGPQSVNWINVTYILQLSTHSRRVVGCCQHQVAIICQKRESRPAEILFYDAMLLWSICMQDNVMVQSHPIFLRSGLPWIIWHQQNNLVLNDLQWSIEKNTSSHLGHLARLCRIEWKRTLLDLEKAPNVAYQYVFNGFNSAWGVKGLIVTRSNLVITWEVGP
jgi:hypothetical protein